MDDDLEPTKTLTQCAGEVLREWRLGRGQTLTALADQSGYSRSSLTDLERGRRLDMFVSKLDAVVSAYGLELLDVLHSAQERQYSEE